MAAGNRAAVGGTGADEAVAAVGADQSADALPIGAGGGPEDRSGGGAAADDKPVIDADQTADSEFVLVAVGMAGGARNRIVRRGAADDEAAAVVETHQTANAEIHVGADKAGNGTGGAANRDHPLVVADQTTDIAAAANRTKGQAGGYGRTGFVVANHPTDVIGAGVAADLASGIAAGDQAIIVADQSADVGSRAAATDAAGGGIAAENGAAIDPGQTSHCGGAAATADGAGGVAVGDKTVVASHQATDIDRGGSCIDRHPAVGMAAGDGSVGGIEADQAAGVQGPAAHRHRAGGVSGADGAGIPADQAADVCQSAHRHAGQAEIADGAGVLREQPDIGGSRQIDGEARDGVTLPVEDAGKGR